MRSWIIKRKHLIILLSLIFVSLIILGYYIFISINYVPRAELLEESNIIEDDIGNDVFYARIKEIREYNGITTVLINGIESNDINHRGEFDFSINSDTELLWKNIKIELSDLKEGQNVSITSTGEVLERYPAKLTRVTRVIVLDNEL